MLYKVLDNHRTLMISAHTIVIDSLFVSVVTVLRKCHEEAKKDEYKRRRESPGRHPRRRRSNRRVSNFIIYKINYSLIFAVVIHFTSLL